MIKIEEPAPIQRKFRVTIDFNETELRSFRKYIGEVAPEISGISYEDWETVVDFINWL
jgi:hypothetical protein